MTEHRITIEIGTIRSLPLVGRDMAAAAIAARDQRIETPVTYNGHHIATVIPGAGPEHLTELNPSGVDKLRAWLERPNGALVMGRVTFEAVSGGGIMVRTEPYRVSS